MTGFLGFWPGFDWMFRLNCIKKNADTDIYLGLDGQSQAVLHTFQPFAIFTVMPTFFILSQLSCNIPWLTVSSLSHSPLSLSFSLLCLALFILPLSLLLLVSLYFFHLSFFLLSLSLAIQSTFNVQLLSIWSKQC